MLLLVLDAIIVTKTHENDANKKYKFPDFIIKIKSNSHALRITKPPVMPSNWPSKILLENKPSKIN